MSHERDKAAQQLEDEATDLEASLISGNSPNTPGRALAVTMLRQDAARVRADEFTDVVDGDFDMLLVILHDRVQKVIKWEGMLEAVRKEDGTWYYPIQNVLRMHALLDQDMDEDAA